MGVFIFPNTHTHTIKEIFVEICGIFPYRERKGYGSNGQKWRVGLGRTLTYLEGGDLGTFACICRVV